MKKLLALLVAAVAVNVASAQFYVGLPSSTLVVVEPLSVVNLVGLQVGDHGDGFGYRALLSGAVGANGYAVELGAHAFYTAVGSSVFYVGGGAGFTYAGTNFGGVGSPFVEPLIGGDFDVDSEISYFVEVGPRLYLDSTVMVTARAGLNFRFGVTPPRRALAPVVTQPVAAQPVVAQTVAAPAPVPATPTVVYDEDGNRYLVPYDPDGE